MKLTRGQYALVDAEDYEWLRKFRWQVLPPRSSGYTWYAQRGVYLGKIGGRYRYSTCQLHREVMRCKHGDGTTVDHVNGNGLDCRKANLEIVTSGENSRRGRKRRGTKSKHRGVSWNGHRNRWAASIRLGEFRSDRAAGEAYARARNVLYKAGLLK